MSRLIWGVAVAVTLWLTQPTAQAQAVDVDDLLAGVVATHTDADGQTSVTLIEPAPALSLPAGTAAHPRLSARGGRARWQGYLNLLATGSYQFRAELLGQVTVKVNGKVVFTAQQAGDQAVTHQGEPVRLEAGVQALEVEFVRPGDGPARMDLMWRGPNFGFEPIPPLAVGHTAAQAGPAAARHALIERGRFLAEEHSCTKCHLGDNQGVVATLKPRVGPNLSAVASRTYPQYLRDWLRDPHQHRPNTVMPAMFGDDQQGKAEIEAVAAYLESLAPPLTPPGPLTVKEAKAKAEAIKRGEGLFVSTGCIACHPNAAPKLAEPPDHPLYGLGSPTGALHYYLLGDLSNKTRPDKLGEYLKDPLAINPSGRMPSLNLSPKEASDLAHYLCRGGAPVAAAPAKANPALIQQGRALIVSKGCTNCHTVTEKGKPLPTQPLGPGVAQLIQGIRATGCLSGDGQAAGNAPRYRFAKADVEALIAFFKEGLQGSGAPSPTYEARVALKRFACLNCHQRDGEGGLSAQTVELLRQYETPENAENLLPPMLNGVGHKLLTPWLKQVLTAAGRSRPWMALRMPQYGPDNVGFLAEALAHLEGAVPDATVHQVKIDAAKITAGRQLIGKSGMGCISCHDIAGIANTGTRGPDLATTNQRVRYDWYLRWMEQPQRMQPGTKMPQVFSSDGKSILPTILGGSAQAQGEAMWAYMSLGPTLPLPEGLEPPRGLVLTVRQRVELLRTFLPEAGARALAIGFPGGISVAYDAATCRPVYAWAGGYVDATPVWANRGGAPAKVLGPRLWTAPRGFPWGFSTNDRVPDFAVIANDPAYGASLPEGKLYTGKLALRFGGYTLDSTGTPTFRCTVVGSDETVTQLSERINPLVARLANGISRTFTLEQPAKQTAYFHAGVSPRAGRVVDRRGAAVELTREGEYLTASTAGTSVVLPADGERVIVLRWSSAPAGTKWLIQQQGTGWDVITRLPASPGPDQPVQATLAIWSVARDDPALIAVVLED